MKVLSFHITEVSIATREDRALNILSNFKVCLKAEKSTTTIRILLAMCWGPET